MADRQRELFEDLPELEPPPDLAGGYVLPSAPAPRGESPPGNCRCYKGRHLQRHGDSGPGGATSAEAAGGALAPEIWPIPARCPVTGGRSCYRDGYYHFHVVDDGRCAHPEGRGRQAEAAYPVKAGEMPRCRHLRPPAMRPSRVARRLGETSDFLTSAGIG